MNAKHVVVVDDETRTYHAVTFLLRMRGYRVTEVTSLEEAINWVTIRNKLAEKLDLMLINRLLYPVEPLRLFAEFGPSTSNVPILLVDRRENRNVIAKLPKEIFQKGSVTLCQPEAVCDSLDLILKRRVDVHSGNKNGGRAN
ncbi:MAG: response regulator transcription factor [Desulfuromonadales bacterium]|nr:response regulator transcription factor [Desulfuromonadales bacterium]